MTLPKISRTTISIFINPTKPPDLIVVMSPNKQRLSISVSVPCVLRECLDILQESPSYLYHNDLTIP